MVMKDEVIHPAEGERMTDEKQGRDEEGKEMTGDEERSEGKRRLRREVGSFLITFSLPSLFLSP